MPMAIVLRVRGFEQLLEFELEQLLFARRLGDEGGLGAKLNEDVK